MKGWDGTDYYHESCPGASEKFPTAVLQKMAPGGDYALIAFTIKVEAVNWSDGQI